MHKMLSYRLQAYSPLIQHYWSTILEEINNSDWKCIILTHNLDFISITQTGHIHALNVYVQNDSFNCIICARVGYNYVQVL